MEKSEDSKKLGFAEVDLERLRRQGVPEVIYGAGKTAEQIVAIAESLAGAGQFPIMATRLDDAKAAMLRDRFGDAFEYFPLCRLGRIGGARKPCGIGRIVIVAAGTSDLPVAEEARITAETLGNETELIADVGVAGIHRLLSKTDRLRSATVVVAVAGMEGALASVVGGLVACPVIAVPTSVGYGAAFDGIAALLSMMNACAPGISVVNIDNGFGAGFLASRINHVGV